MPGPATLMTPVLEAPPEVRLAVERAQDGGAVAALVERAFGPGRYVKVSERLREGNRLRADLSFCAFGAEVLVGTVRQWPIQVGDARGLFLGPIAVEAGWRKHGVGGRLIQRCCEGAIEADEAFILLVGDEALFRPYGFEPVPAGQVAMPSPVDPARVLAHPLRSGGFVAAGAARVPRL